MENRKNSAVLWIISLFITLFTAFYQRVTGPTFPKTGEFTIGEKTIRYKLLRSHNNEKDYKVQIKNPNGKLSGKLVFKRYKTEDPWTERKMKLEKGFLIGYLPHQPPGGKLIYRVLLTGSKERITLPPQQQVIIRFKGEVPPIILIPHIIIMFAAMLLSNRSGLEALRKKPKSRSYVLWTVGLLFFGGMILGPLVQRFAFDIWWSGFPLGGDLTDTKTLISFVSWIPALIATRKGRPARFWIIGAALITLAIFFIPHSLRGTELDYSKLN